MKYLLILLKKFCMRITHIWLLAKHHAETKRNKTITTMLSFVQKGFGAPLFLGGVKTTLAMENI